jgi:hypothetical protein
MSDQTDWLIAIDVTYFAGQAEDTHCSSSARERRQH